MALENTNSRCSMISSLGTFDPQSCTWQAYRDCMNFYFKANRIQLDDDKKSCFLCSVGMSTYNLLQSLCSPKQLRDDEITFDDLISKLDVHYDPSKSILTATYDFYSCYQKPGQSFTEWKAELCEKLRYCGFNSSVLKDKQQDRALRDMYVIGTSNSKVRQALLKEGDPDLATAEKIIQVVERLENDVRHFNASTNQGGQMVAKVSHESTNTFQSTVKKKSTPMTTTNSCQTCGSMQHSRNECKYRDLKCNFCGRTGHLERVCRQKTETKKFPKAKSNSHRLKRIKRMKESKTSLPLELLIDGHRMVFDVDTGSDHTIIGSNAWKRLGSPILHRSSLKLECYQGEPLNIRGECEVTVEYEGKRSKHMLVVIEEDGLPLLGLLWMKKLGIDLNRLVHKMNRIKTQMINVYSQVKLRELLAKHNVVFNDELGHCTKVTAHIELVADAQPKFFKPRPVPFALVEAVKDEIQRNVERGILERIDSSKWAAPIVPILKPTGKVRICGDFKVTINSQIIVDQHPIPSIDELLTRLNNGEKFSKLDLSDAYLQLELDDTSKELVVINTPLGLFKYNRMPFGIANAPAIFQRTIDQVLAGVPNCIAYLDDILVTGKTEDEHMKTLDIVLSRLADFGLRCNMKKCVFFQDEVLYLGYKINRYGKQPDPQRVTAIRNLPVPKDLKQIEAFIGKVNYYNKFISNFSNLCAPLNRLRQKNVKWQWNKCCQQAFQTLKDRLSEATMLVHFDSTLPIILATDASSYGIGAVIMHRYEDGTERPIAHASKTLTAAEKNYSQIEKEALSIIYGVKKFHQYVAGTTFELVTDHQPLLTIFHPRKGIPTTTANRLQRWAISLMGYSYTIRYKPTLQHANADALSRLPAGDDDSFVDNESIQVNRIHAQIMEESPVDCVAVRKAVDEDQHLQTIRKYIRDKWPNSISRQKDPDIYQFYVIRDSLSVVNGCLLKDTQVVIPKSLRFRVLQMIHRSHLGVVKMKQMARMHCWWPRMELDIEQLAKNCQICASLAVKPREEFKPWPEPEQVWSRVHMDFLGPLWNSKWLIMIDAKSKFPFVAEMGNDTSANKLCEVLEEAIDWLGPPTTLVSDNGPPFNSQVMQSFYKRYGIERVTTAPYHPASNGIAERFVRSFKEGMIKQQHSGQTNKFNALRNVLRTYRWTPHSTTGIAPAEMLFKRSIRTELARLKPIKRDHPQNQTKFNPHQLVWIMDHRQNKRPEWKPGVVQEKIGSMMFNVQFMDGQMAKRHQNQLRARQQPADEGLEIDLISDGLLNIEGATEETTTGPERQQQTVVQTHKTPPRYPKRNRKPPNRYSP